MQVLKPARLKPGSLIGLASPASTPTPSEKIQGSVRYLERLGYRVKVGENVAKEHGYLAGTDEERAADLNALIENREVAAIFALRGGYGTPRILPRVNYSALRRHPKIISGFSDITALQLAIYRKCRLVTFSGPMPAVEFWKEPDPFTEENFWRLLTSTATIGPFPHPPDQHPRTLKPGVVTGVLLGGNLSLISATIGTPFLPSFRRALLVLEEVDEPPYRIDRMLSQLTNSGLSRAVGAIIVGGLTRCEPKDKTRPSLSSPEVILDFVNQAGKPAITDLCYGHTPRKLTLPFGLRAKLTAGETAQLEVLEAGVE